MNHILLLLMMLSAVACNQAAQKSNETTAPIEYIEKDFTEFYDNGQLKIEGKLLNDQRHGLWTAYYENGIKWSETTFKMGVKSGQTTTYFEDGMMRYTGTFYNDERTGEWLFYDEDGLVIKKVDFTPRMEGDSLVVPETDLLD